MALDGRIDPKKASGLNIEFECRAGAFSTLGYDAIGIVDALWSNVDTRISINPRIHHRIVIWG